MKEIMRLQNKTAIVTGSSSGIGQAIAQRFLAEGAKVVFSDLVLDESIKQYGEQATFVPCDVADSAQVKNLVQAAVEKFGRLDIMVNNAGIGSFGDITELTDEAWQKVIAVNLSGVFYGLRAAAQQMKEQKIAGSIINLSSILGGVGFKGLAPYCSAKGGVNQLTRTAALELAAAKIRVNAIAPGFIATNMTKGVKSDSQLNDFINFNTPLGRMGEPADIASAAVYLASEEARYVTGSVLYVDGGWTAH